MKRKFLIIRGLLLMMLILSVMSTCAFAAYDAAIQATHNSSQNLSGVYDSINARLVLAGCTVEVLDCGGNGQYDPPGTGDDYIIAVGKIVYGFDDPLGRFSVLSSVVATHKIYVRVWNGSTEAQASHYGTSEVTTVPTISEPPAPGQYWDVGSGGGWNTTGDNAYAFYVNTPNPAARPIISSILLPTVWMGTMETINGSLFGSPEPTSYIKISNYQVAATDCVTWEPNRILVTIEAGMKAGGGSVTQVTVHANYLDSVPSSDLTILPLITSADPTINLLTGIHKVTITGGGFGTSGSALFNGVTATDVPGWGISLITAEVPAGAIDGNIIISVNTQTSNPWAFTMATPSIISIDPNEGNVSKETVITGNNFGTVEGTDREGLANHISFNGIVPSDNIIDWTNTLIRFSVPSVPIAAAYTLVSVEAGGNLSNATTYTVTPEISSYEANYYIGDDLVLGGTAFGPTIGSSTLTLGNGGNTYALAPGTWSPTSITASISNNLPVTMDVGATTAYITVEPGSYKTNTVTFTSHPNLSSINPSVGIGGTLVTLEGYGFKDTQGGSSVVFGSTLATVVGRWTNTTIEVSAPSLVSPQNVKVTVNSEDSQTISYSYVPGPIISGILPTEAPAGGYLKITGTNFGTTGIVTIGGYTVTDYYASWSSTIIECQIPTSVVAASGVAVTVWTNGQSDTDNTLTVTSGGLPPTEASFNIHNVRFDNRAYITGEVVASKPVITAYISPIGPETFDWNYRDCVKIDGSSINDPLTANVTYEPGPFPGEPGGTYKLMAKVLQPISAAPVRGHEVKITAMNLSLQEKSWTGTISVMSGTVQMIGPAYNFPNPFKPLTGRTADDRKTRISYSLNVNATVTILIYDITGHEVHRRTYHSGVEGGRAGVNQIEWDGHDVFGEVVGNGMFVYKIISGNKVIGTGKLVVLD